MATRKRLTKKVVDAARYPYEVPSKRCFYVMEEELQGFGLRVYDSGRKAFFLRYSVNQGPRRLITIGTYGKMTVDTARKKARELLVQIEKGIDPLEKKQTQRAVATVSELCSQYLKRYAKPHKKSWRVDESRIERHIKARWGRRRATSVTDADVARMRDDIGQKHPVEANRTVTLVHTIWARGSEWGLLPKDAANPAAGVPKFKEQARERWLTREELGRLFSAIEDSAYDFGVDDSISSRCLDFLEANGPQHVASVAEHVGHPQRKTGVLLASLVSQGRLERVSRGVYRALPRELRQINPRGLQIRSLIMLYLLTGARKRELLRARWQHCDLEHRLLRIPDTKTGREHRIHLSEPAVELLKALPTSDTSPFLFPGKSANKHLVNIDKAWRRIRTRAGLEDVTLHDLRRTVGSWLVQSGVPLPTIKKVLNQSTDFAAQIYARIGDATARGALEDHGRVIAAIAADANTMKDVS